MQCLIIETVLSTNELCKAVSRSDHTSGTDDGATACKRSVIQQCHL